MSHLGYMPRHVKNQSCQCTGHTTTCKVYQDAQKLLLLYPKPLEVHVAMTLLKRFH